MILFDKDGRGGSITLGFDGAVRIVVNLVHTPGVNGSVTTDLPVEVSVKLARAILRAAGEKQKPKQEECAHTLDRYYCCVRCKRAFEYQT